MAHWKLVVLGECDKTVVFHFHMTKLRNASKTTVKHLFSKSNVDGYVTSKLFNMQKGKND